MLYENMIFKKDFLKVYQRRFNDYMIGVLYPDLITAQEYIKENDID